MQYQFEKDNGDRLGNRVEEKVEEVAKELQINLPSVDLPIALKLIALFTLIGGLSIIGSFFSDIIRPTQVSFGDYFLRIVVGIVSVAIAWMILERKRIAIWLYAILSLVGFFTNPIVALLPLGVAIYLYISKDYFYPSILDQVVSYVATAIKNRLKGQQPV